MVGVHIPAHREPLNGKRPADANSVLAPSETSTLSPGVSDDPTQDPDLIVLGFQELDLSTEALIYSTSTVKADAWCTAVFAGLGEKGVLYERVIINLWFVQLLHLIECLYSSQQSNSSECSLLSSLNKP